MASVGYDEPSRTMHVRFNDGAVHEYHPVDPEQHEALMTSESKGKHFEKHFRKRYSSKKIS